MTIKRFFLKSRPKKQLPLYEKHWNTVLLDGSSSIILYGDKTISLTIDTTTAFDSHLLMDQQNQVIYVNSLFNEFLEFLDRFIKTISIKDYQYNYTITITDRPHSTTLVLFPQNDQNNKTPDKKNYQSQPQYDSSDRSILGT